MAFIDRAAAAAEVWSGRPPKLVFCSRAGLRVYGFPEHPTRGGFRAADLLLLADWPAPWFRLYYLKNCKRKKLRFDISIIKTRL